VYLNVSILLFVYESNSRLSHFDLSYREARRHQQASQGQQGTTGKGRSLRRWTASSASDHQGSGGGGSGAATLLMSALHGGGGGGRQQRPAAQNIAWFSVITCSLVPR
jgi:hypothetical protein